MLVALGCSEAAAPGHDAGAVADADAVADAAALPDAAADAVTDAAAAADAVADAAADAVADAAADADAAAAADAAADAVADTGIISGEPCQQASDCPPLQPDACAAWTCATGICDLTVAPVGTPCGPTLGCREMRCNLGACVPTALACPSPGACTTATCNLASGACVATPLPAAATCSSDDLCQPDAHCDGAGLCIAAAVACPSGPCSLAACDPQTGACVATPLPAGASCTDGDPCTLDDACDGKGACLSTATLPCPASSPCQSSACDPLTGACVAGPWTCACKTDADCDDADVCTAEACVAGSCVTLPLDATLCDDGNACTADACTPATGACGHTALSELGCDDGDLCTLGDLCQSGVCVSGAAKSCPGGGPCAQVGCDPTTGQCLAVPLSGACTPSSACVVAASCESGACVDGAGLDCDDDVDCTVDACEPATGACSHAAAPGGTACGSGGACFASGCGCKHGPQLAPQQGQEWLRAVVPYGGGFAAVGDSDAPGSARGLLLRVDGEGTIALQRRYGGISAVSFVAVARDPSLPALRVGATLAGQHAVLLLLDGLGNTTAQEMVTPFATTQAVAAVGAMTLMLVAESWQAGAASRLVRLAAPNQPLWTRPLPPAAASGTFRGHALFVLGGEVHVFGHDVDPAAPLLTAGRRFRVDLALGTSLAADALALPQGGVVLAAASDGVGVVLAGTRLGGSGGAVGHWTGRLAQQGGGLVLADAIVSEEVGAFAGVASLGTTRKPGPSWAVGWRGGSTPAALLRRVDVDGAPTVVEVGPAGSGPLALHAAAALEDGAWVAVGSAETAKGSAAMWLRLSPGWPAACP
ncbi:MAG: hypothetical protein H6747_08095 [Deltaproteobacteria bacterium]|nr:hypothetical protein [Deltaproteobacteria bacterium]